MKHMRLLGAILFVSVSLSGCKYYGSAVPPEYPVSMDDALDVATDRNTTSGGIQRPIVRKLTRPEIDQPTYVPEKELAVVAPPKTLLVWSYPHVTDDNTRVFGNWATIFINDRYEWIPPTNEVPAEEMTFGGGYGASR